MTKLDQILKEAKDLMSEAEEEQDTHGLSHTTPVSIYLGIKALYKQNEAIIELLKEYQK